MKKIYTLLGSLTILLLLAGCSSEEATNQGEESPETVEILDSADHTVEVPADPERVAVFDNAQIDNLDALDLGDRIVVTASSNLPDYLSEYKEVEVAGTLHEVDLEITNANDPDLAIVAARSSASFEALSDFVPTLDFSLSKATPFESITYNFTELSKIFNKEEAAEAILAELEQEQEELQQAAADSELNALMVMYNEGSLSVYGPDSRFSHVYDDFGFTPAAEDIEASTHGMEVSYEYLIQEDPDVIFVLDRTIAISEDLNDVANVTSSFEENPLIEETTAYQNGQIYYLTPDTWYLSNGGVQAYQQMMDDVRVVFE